MSFSIAARFAFSCGSFVMLSALVSPAYAELTVSTAPTSEVTCTNGICTTTGKHAVLNVSQLESLLAAGNVSVVGLFRGNDAKLAISAGISWASANTLTFSNFETISLNNTIAMDGTGGLTVVSSGPVSYGPGGNITSLSTANNLFINSISYTLVDTIGELAADIAANPTGDYALAGSYDAHPDGTYSSAPVMTTFTGVFDGLGNNISHLAVKNTQGGSAALFAQIGTKATVQNLFLVKTQIAGSGSNPLFMGTLAGINYGTIFHCFGSGHETGSGTDGIYEGGLVGENEGAIYNSGAAVDVKATQSSMIGGLVGLSIGVSSTNATIRGSFASGAVSGGGGQSFLGGLVGDSYEMDFSGIQESYATGAVAGGAADSVGGLIGFAQDSTIGSTYASGTISGGTSHEAYGFAGGLVGYDAGGNSYSSSYWDTTTSGLTAASEGAGNYPNLPGITGLTSTQLQSGLPNGFETYYWAERARTNNGFPYLIIALPQ
jgi:hypothetical protein